MNNSYGVKASCSDFIGVLFSYTDSLKIVVGDDFNGKIGQDFEERFCDMIGEFVDLNFGEQAEGVSFRIFYDYNRKELSGVIKSQKTKALLDRQSDMLREYFIRVNNYSYIFDQLRQNEFYRGLLFREKGSRLEESYRRWLRRESSAIAELTFSVYFHNFIFSSVYDFNEKNIKQYDHMRVDESGKVLRELESIIKIIRNEMNTDLTELLKTKIFSVLLNAFVVKLSYVIFLYRGPIFKTDLIKRFEEHINTLLRYFKNAKEARENENFLRDLMRFKSMMFVERVVKDDKDNRLVHFVYKLRNKRKSIF